MIGTVSRKDDVHIERHTPPNRLVKLLYRELSA
jgi:hypothetical protein